MLNIERGTMGTAALEAKRADSIVEPSCIPDTQDVVSQVPVLSIGL